MMSATSIVSIDCLFASSFRIRNPSATCKFSRHAPADLTRHTWRPGRGCSTPRGSDDFPLPPWRKSSLLRLVAKCAGSVMAMGSPRLPRLLPHGKQRVVSSRPPSRSRSRRRSASRTITSLCSVHQHHRRRTPRSFSRWQDRRYFAPRPVEPHDQVDRAIWRREPVALPARTRRVLLDVERQ